MTTLTDLIERLEKATGPSRELDAAIQRTLAGNPGTHWFGSFGIWTNDHIAPKFTESIDAAAALVPDGWVWTVNTFLNGASAYVMNSANEQLRCDKAATAAIALCIAALKAAQPGERI